MKKAILQSLICIFICAVLGSVLLTIANYLPIHEGNKEASLSELSQEGLFPSLPGLVRTDGDFHSFDPAALELATDALMVKMALYEGDGAGIHQAFYAYSTQFEEEYSRYWHGYVVLLRPLLYVFDYWELRIVNGILQLLLVFVVCMLIQKRLGIRYALLGLTSYVLFMPMALVYCLQYSWIFYVTYGILLLLLLQERYWTDSYRYLILFTLSGCLAIYFDLMTYPLISWGLPAIWFLVLTKEETPLKHLVQLIQTGIAWLIGYLGMWVMKWVIGSIVLRQNLFARAMEEVKLWLFNGSDEALSVSERLLVIYENVSTYAYKLYVCLLLLWAIYLVIAGIKRGMRLYTKTPAYMLVAVSPIVWYFVMAGHSRMHHIFTHRIFVIFITAGIASLLIGMNERNLQDKETDTEAGPPKEASLPGGIQRRIVAGMWLVATVIGIIAMLQLRTERISANWEQNFESSDLPDGSFEVEFTPTAKEIRQISIGIGNDSDTGYYLVSILLGDELKEQLSIPISEYDGGRWLWVDVDWKVIPDTTYTIRVETFDATEVTQIWLTDGNATFAEIGDLRISGENVAFQPLIGVNYWDRLTKKTYIILFFLLYSGFVMLVLGTVAGFINIQKYKRE